MSDPAHTLSPATDEAPREILDLADAIVQLPREYRLRVEPLLNRVLDNAKRRRGSWGWSRTPWANSAWT